VWPSPASLLDLSSTCRSCSSVAEACWRRSRAQLPRHHAPPRCPVSCLPAACRRNPPPRPRLHFHGRAFVSHARQPSSHVSPAASGFLTPFPATLPPYAAAPGTSYGIPPPSVSSAPPSPTVVVVSFTTATLSGVFSCPSISP
jgi:hypothetical protein